MALKRSSFNGRTSANGKDRKRTSGVWMICSIIQTELANLTAKPTPRAFCKRIRPANRVSAIHSPVYRPERSETTPSRTVVFFVKRRSRGPEDERRLVWPSGLVCTSASGHVAYVAAAWVDCAVVFELDLLKGACLFGLYPILHEHYTMTIVAKDGASTAGDDSAYGDDSKTPYASSVRV
jgi:hypothetical protein